MPVASMDEIGLWVAGQPLWLHVIFGAKFIFYRMGPAEMSGLHTRVWSCTAASPPT